MNESKVNQKSQKLVIKKIEKDLVNVLDFVDDEGTALITYNGLGYILFFLDVFKIQYNDEYMAKLMQINSKSNIKDSSNEHMLNHSKALSFVTAKNEERRVEEESFHRKLWKLLNPFDGEYIEREILNEFLKLMFDPYTQMKSLIPIIKELIDIIHKAKSMKVADESDHSNELKDRAPTMKAVQKWIETPNTDPRSGGSNNYTMNQYKIPLSLDKHFDNSQVASDSISMTIEEILNSFKDLYNYQGGNRKIKIPSYK